MRHQCALDGILKTSHLASAAIKQKMSLDLAAFIGKHLKFRQTVEYTGHELLELIEMYKIQFCNEEDSCALIEVPIPLKIVGES